MLVDINELLPRAREHKCAVGAYVFLNLDMMQGILQAAEETHTPVILLYPGGPYLMDKLDVFGPAMVAAAEKASVPVCLHLDHGPSFEYVVQCVEAGFKSVMIDASVLPFEENLALTKKVVEYCHPKGVTVEGEIGHVGEGSDYNLKTYQYTDVDEAVRYVNETGIDCLAVAIGNAHGQYVEEPKINFEVLEKIEKAISIPLVMHGGSGISDADFKEAIKHGIAKVNIFTENVVAAAEKFKALPEKDLNPINTMYKTEEAFKEHTIEKIELFETAKWN